jgi:hypothetical protein
MSAEEQNIFARALLNLEAAWRKSPQYTRLLAAGETEEDHKHGPDVYGTVLRNLKKPASRQSDLWKAARASNIGKRLIAFQQKYPWWPES